MQIENHLLLVSYPSLQSVTWIDGYLDVFIVTIWSPVFHSDLLYQIATRLTMQIVFTDSWSLSNVGLGIVSSNDKVVTLGLSDISHNAKTRYWPDRAPSWDTHSFAVLSLSSLMGILWSEWFETWRFYLDKFIDELSNIMSWASRFSVQIRIKQVRSHIFVCISVKITYANGVRRVRSVRRSSHSEFRNYWRPTSARECFRR